MIRHDPTMIDLIHAERAHDAEQRARARRLRPTHPGREPMRRAVGRQLIRIGSSLAQEPMPKPARSRAGDARV